MARYLMADKVALVTGGGSGIGRSTALAFAREKAKVVVADVDIADGNETVRLIEANGGQGIFVKTDVRVAAEVAAMVTEATRVYGRLDYAHNNAGVESRQAAVIDVTEEDWDRILDINLKGIWLCLKYEIPQMLKQGGGAIVNTSSIAGLTAAINAAPYVASKHGILGLTKVAAAEYIGAGIRINALCPGLISTPMMERLSDPRSKGKPVLGPISRLGDPTEIAEAVVWLCSDAASFVTGHALVADGGKTAAEVYDS